MRTTEEEVGLEKQIVDVTRESREQMKKSRRQ